MLIKKYYLTNHFNTRRGEKLESVKYIVITSSRYAGFSPLKNRNIIERSKYNEEVEFSCHYIVGDKEILQIIPKDEMAICTKNHKIDLNSISIMLTKDINGNYSKEQLKKLRRLVQKLMEMYNLSKDEVILEYDINGSRRPEIFVDERILLEEITKKDEA